MLDKIDYNVVKVHVIGCQPVQVSLDDTTVTNATLAMDKQCRLHPAEGGELFLWMRVACKESLIKFNRGCGGAKMVRPRMRISRSRFAVDYRWYGVLPVFAAVVVILWRQVHASEFPERECCDPIYPPMPSDPEPIPPALPTAIASSSQATPIGRSGTLHKRQISVLLKPFQGPQ